MDAEEKGKGHSEKRTLRELEHILKEVKEFGDEESIEPRESLKKEVFSEAEWAEKDFNG